MTLEVKGMVGVGVKQGLVGQLHVVGVEHHLPLLFPTQPVQTVAGDVGIDTIPPTIHLPIMRIAPTTERTTVGAILRFEMLVHEFPFQREREVRLCGHQVRFRVRFLCLGAGLESLFLFLTRCVRCQVHGD